MRQSIFVIVWLTRAALRGHIMIFMTANDTETGMKHRRLIYERILKHLSLEIPIRDDRTAKAPKRDTGL